MSGIESTTSPTAELDAIKAKQNATWSSGDFGIIGTTLQIVGESLCEAVDLRAGSKVLDVAAGNGNCSLAAARRFCDVTSTDYVPALLEDGRRRAEADRLPIRFQVADAEALPFRRRIFRRRAVVVRRDVHAQPRARGRRTAACLPPRRKDRPGQLDARRLHRQAVRRHRPPRAAAPGAHAAVALGRGGLPGQAVSRFGVRHPHHAARFRLPLPSAQHWIDVFRTWYGPVHKAFAGLPAEKQQQLSDDLHALIRDFNTSGDATAVIPAEYLEVVITKK